MKLFAIAVAAVAGIIVVAGCGSAHSTGGVPSIASGTSGHSSSGGYSASRVVALHAAAACIRSHGIPSYQDPVLTANGQVFTDSRSIQDYLANHADSGSKQDNAAVQAVLAPCGALIAVAGLQPEDEAPAPSRLVEAGVKLAQCLRAHGLPNFRDPTSSSPFTPGHGFGISADELPNNGANGKQDPTFQSAFGACQAQNDAEIKASELSSLAHD